MTQTMTAIDNVAFIDFVKALDSELNNDMHVCSTEPYIYSLTKIGSRNKLSEMAVPQTELATDFSNEVKSLQPRMPKLACDTKRKQLSEKFFLSSVLQNKHSWKSLMFLNLILSTVNYSIYWKFWLKTITFSLNLLMMLEKSRKNSMLNWKRRLNYGSNDLPKYLCCTEID